MQNRPSVIGDLCNLVGGSQPEKATFVFEPKDGYVRLIQTRDYKTDSYKTYIKASATKKFCSEHDVMIGRYGPPVFQILRGLAGAYNVALMKADPKPNVSREFLYYVLKQPRLFDYIEYLSKRTGGQTGIDVDALKNYPVFAPSTEVEQFNHIESLYLIDKKIALNNKINAELEAMAKLIYDYWFVQFDFPDKSGKPYKSSGGEMVWCDQLKREIPEGWAASDVVSVTELIKRGISPDYTEEEGLRVINQRCIRNQTINFGAARTHKGSMDSDDPRVVRHWDVLVNSTGVGTLGRVAHVKVPTKAPYVTDSHVTTLRADVSRIARPYFAYSLKRLQPVIEAAANGSTGQVELSRPYLEGIKFVVPDDDLQNDFGAIVSQISKKQALAETENQELASLRDWLLPMLMNGQVSVGEEVLPSDIKEARALREPAVGVGADQ